MERSKEMKGTALIEYCGNGMYRYIDSDGIEHILREPVKCKDCKNYYPEDKPHQKRGCMYGGICERPDDFCSKGEKR